tara:strand:- start:838 stop:1743 length:906 start_codon:yes stop_codon:yes gene_type:complete
MRNKQIKRKQIFNILINRINSRKNKTIKYFDNEVIPKIYYIGSGRSASKYLIYCFYNNTVAHWHDTAHFEKCYSPDDKLLSNNNYDIYDLILYIGKKFKFKPLIVESIREPISKTLSAIFYQFKNRYLPPKCNSITSIRNNMSSNDLINIKKRIKPMGVPDINKDCYSFNMYRKHFKFDITKHFNSKKGYYFNELKNVYLLLLRYENIKSWNIVNKLSLYKFNLEKGTKFMYEYNRLKQLIIHENRTQEEKIFLKFKTKYSNITHKKLKFTNTELNQIYNPFFSSFYTQNEKNEFIKKYSL